MDRDRTIGKELAERLKVLMKNRPDLDTQAKLATACGMSQTTIGRILKNKVSPTLEHVGLIADVFGLTIGELVVQDKVRFPEMNYDRQVFSSSPAPLKRKIESYVEWELSAYAAHLEAIKHDRRISDSVMEPEDEQRKFPHAYMNLCVRS